MATRKIIVITAIGFIIYAVISLRYFSVIRENIDGLINYRPLSYFLSYLITGIPIFISLIVLHPLKNFLESVGLNKNLFRGLVIAFLFSSPMLIGYAVFFNFNNEITLQRILIGSVFAGFFEELFFRGFLFGQIFRYTKFGFFPAILLGALLFGLGHLHQSSDPLTLLGIFLITTIGAIFFAWLYVEWDYNLWVIIGLHLFMNLHWALFSAGDNALGGTISNVFRLLTIIAAITGTIMYKRQKQKKFTVNKTSIWMRT